MYVHSFRRIYIYTALVLDIYLVIIGATFKTSVHLHIRLNVCDYICMPTKTTLFKQFVEERLASMSGAVLHIWTLRKIL